jgi:hypothetical protein
VAAIVTYHVSEKHLELKKALLDLGYRTTLYHASKTPEQVASDVRSLCERMEINLAQCLAANLVEWHAIGGQSIK